MYRRILVPLDGSERAEGAAAVAARYARRTGSELLLLRVVHAPPRLGFTGEPPIVAMEAAQEDVLQAQAYLQKVARRAEFAGLDVDTLALEGQAVPTILEVVEDEIIDALMLSSHGRTGPARWVLGSVAHALVRSAPVPVFVLREHGSFVSLDEDRGLRALVALDGSERAERAIVPAADLIQGLSTSGQAVLRLVRVVQTLDAPTSASVAPATAHVEQQLANHSVSMNEARAYLRAVCDRLERNELAGRSVTLESVAVASHDVGYALVEAAKGVSSPGVSDVIAMATHGRTGIEGWVLGSIAEHVLDTAPMPMLVISTRAHAGQDTGEVAHARA